MTRREWRVHGRKPGGHTTVEGPEVSRLISHVQMEGFEVTRVEWREVTMWADSRIWLSAARGTRLASGDRS